MPFYGRSGGYLCHSAVQRRSRGRCPDQAPGLADEALEVGEDGRLTWTIGDITKDTKTVTFTIKLKEDNTEAGELYTNRDVNLTFDSTALDETVQFTQNAIGTPQIGVYSVRYTDGVDSAEVFKDQITYNLVEGDATPTFAGGNPQREDHTFLGWSPSVLETISGDIYEIVYTAQWTPNTTPRQEHGARKYKKRQTSTALWMAPRRLSRATRSCPLSLP